MSVEMDKAGADPAGFAAGAGGTESGKAVAAVFAAAATDPIIGRAMVRFWNLASAELYGVAAEQALGRTLDSLLQPAERADEYRNAIDKDPQYAPAKLQSADACLRIRDASTAVEPYGIAADLRPDHVDTS